MGDVVYVDDVGCIGMVMRGIGGEMKLKWGFLGGFGGVGVVEGVKVWLGDGCWDEVV